MLWESSIKDGKVSFFLVRMKTFADCLQSWACIEKVMLTIICDCETKPLALIINHQVNTHLSFLLTSSVLLISLSLSYRRGWKWKWYCPVAALQKNCWGSIQFRHQGRHKLNMKIIRNQLSSAMSKSNTTAMEVFFCNEGLKRPILSKDHVIQIIANHLIHPISRWYSMIWKYLIIQPAIASDYSIPSDNPMISDNLMKSNYQLLLKAKHSI